jgi:hypothetical protein
LQSGGSTKGLRQTGIIARMLQLSRGISAEQFLEASHSTVYGYHD